MYVPQHSENVCISTFRKCMYINIQKMYVPLHSENVCTSTFRKCMYLNIHKMYVPLHHRHLFHSKNICPPLPYFNVNIYPFPLPLNIFRLFVILSLTQLYRYIPEIFLFSTATFKYKYWAPLRRIGQEKSANVAY